MLLNAIKVATRRVAGFFRQRRLDTDLTDEIQSHLDLLTDDYVRRGRSSDERLTVVAGDGPAMLVRPDGIVAWVAGDVDLDEALRRWFGGFIVEAVAASV